jgi:hypothetical protein
MHMSYALMLKKTKNINVNALTSMGYFIQNCTTIENTYWLFVLTSIEMTFK